MNFGEVLSRAWEIIWKHKVLWIFGIFAGCANSGGGAGNARVTTDELPQSVERFFTETPSETLILMAIILVVVVLVLVVLAILLGTIGRIGLIRGSLQADQQDDTHLVFGELFSGSLPYFWRVFLLSLLVGLAIILVILALVVVFALGSVLTLGIGLLCLIPLICLMIPIFWIVGVLLEQSTIAIVIEDLSITDGLRRGWEVVRDNVGTILVMWLILGLGISMIGGLIISLPIIIIMVPAIISIFVGTDTFLSEGILTSAICFIAYMPVLILLNGVLRSYVSTAWTLTFLRITAPLENIPEQLPDPIT